MTDYKTDIDYPADITFRPFSIYEKDGNYFTDKCVKDLVADKISKMKPYFVNYQTGIDTNDGLTEQTPKKLISSAYTAGARLIYLTGGIHYNNSWGLLNVAYTNTDDFFVIGKGVNYITSAPATPPIYTLETGNTYKATQSAVTMAVDMKYTDSKGFPLCLSYQTSVADVDLNPGSYYVSGSDIYIHLTDNRTPDSYILTLTSNVSAKYRANAGYHYVENITFIGGGSSTGTHGVESTVGVNSTLAALSYKCNFLYGCAPTYDGNGGEGTRNLNNYINWSEDCIAYGNARDGFNYVGDIANPINIVELNCQSFDNGLRLTSSSVNGSSNHIAGQVLRINSKYYRNSGPNVADVNATITANYGVTAFDSLEPTGTHNVDFEISGNGKMFNYGCVSLGSACSFKISGALPSCMVNSDNTVADMPNSIFTPAAPQTITTGVFPLSDTYQFVFPALSSFVDNGHCTRSVRWEETAYTGIPSWTGTAPLGTPVATFKATQSDNVLSGRISSIYPTAGVGLTTVVVPLPAVLPVPATVTGFDTNFDYMITCNGGMFTAKSTLCPLSRCGIRKTSTGNYSVVITLASGNYTGFMCDFTYFI